MCACVVSVRVLACVCTEGGGEKVAGNKQMRQYNQGEANSAASAGKKIRCSCLEAGARRLGIALRFKQINIPRNVVADHAALLTARVVCKHADPSEGI